MPDIAPDPLVALAEAVRAVVAAEVVAPEGLDADGAARHCGLSRSAWYELDRRNLCPAPVTLGDSKRVWLRSELTAWLRVGAPARINWRVMRTQVLKAAG